MPTHAPRRTLLAGLALLQLQLVACSPPAPQADLTEIASEILATWDHAALVCLGENHGSLADAALRTALFEHPAFPSTVDVVVLESASGVHQGLLDRFLLDGEELSREELQGTWRDAGRGVVWELPIYEELLRTLRRVNLDLPPRQRVRLLGGAVPIPWGEVHTAEDLLPWLDRETHLEKLLQEEVLDRDLQGLAVYGSFHCEKTGASAAAALHGKNPGRVFSVFSFAGEEGAREGRERLGLGATPAFVPFAGTAEANRLAGASFFEGHIYNGARFGDLLDAVVSYGSPVDRVLTIDEETLDPAFRREVARRDALWRAAAERIQ